MRAPALNVSPLTPMEVQERLVHLSEYFHDRGYPPVRFFSRGIIPSAVEAKRHAHWLVKSAQELPEDAHAERLRCLGVGEAVAWALDGKPLPF